jgi:hypothetical protein
MACCLCCQEIHQRITSEAATPEATRRALPLQDGLPATAARLSQHAHDFLITERTSFHSAITSSIPARLRSQRRDGELCMLHLCCESALLDFSHVIAEYTSQLNPALATETLQAVLAWLFNTGSQQMPLVNCDRCGGTVPSTTQALFICTSVVSSRTALQQPAA